MTILGLELVGILGISLAIAGFLLTLALICAVWRLLVGPSLADRVIALDLISILMVAFLVVFAMASGVDAYMDVAIVLSLVAFLGTIAFARFIERSALEKNDG